MKNPRIKNKLPRTKLGTVTLMCLFVLQSFNLWSQPPSLRLKLYTASGLSDECVLYLQAGASLAFEGDYDAYKLFGPSVSPQLWLEKDSVRFSINGTSLPADSASIALMLRIPADGNYTITGTAEYGWSGFACAFLADKLNGTSMQLPTSTCSFSSSASTHLERFVIRILPLRMQGTATALLPPCNSGQTATLSASVAAGYNRFIWKNSAGQVLRDVLGIAGTDQFQVPGGQTYSLSVTNAQGRRFDTLLVLPSLLPVRALAAMQDTLVKSQQANFFPLNTSQNATACYWNFGDGDVSTSVQPSHAYRQAGTYLVRFKVFSARGCADSMQKVLLVLHHGGGSITSQFKGNKKYEYRGLPPSVNNLNLLVTSMVSYNSSQLQLNRNNASQADADLGTLPDGMYILVLRSGNEVLHRTSILIQ